MQSKCGPQDLCHQASGVGTVHDKDRRLAAYVQPAVAKTRRHLLH